MWDGGRMQNRIILFGVLSLLGCGSSEIRPVDIYPEDVCTFCKMAFSDQRYAAEIISREEEVAKFDDIGCMIKYRNMRDNSGTSTVFVKDYETRGWIPEDRAVIIQTDIMTPMGSGKIAFSDSVGMKLFLRGRGGEKE